jgi:hypothetical protein
MGLTSFQCANTAIRMCAIPQKIGLLVKQIQSGKIGILQHLLSCCKEITENYTSYKSIDKSRKVVYHCIVELIKKMQYVAEITSERSFALSEHAKTFEVWEHFTSRELCRDMFYALTQVKDENFDLWNDVAKNIVIFIDEDGEQSRQVKPWLGLQLKEKYFPIEGSLSPEEFQARHWAEEGLYKFLDIYCAWVAQSYKNYLSAMKAPVKIPYSS